MKEQEILQIQQHFMKMQGVENPEHLDITTVVGKHQIVIDGALREVTVSEKGGLTIGPEVNIAMTLAQLKKVITDSIEHGQTSMAYITMGGKGVAPLPSEEFAMQYITQQNWIE